MGLFLGIDGGQTSTIAVIGNERGEVLGRGKGGPSNHVGAEHGRARLISAVRGALEAACLSAGFDPGHVEFEGACMGATGGPVDKEPILREILRVRALQVTDDATIALTGAHEGAPGIITIAGTGSVSMGRNAAGRCARAGGWGYAIGDEGSAYDLVRRALRASLRFSEGWGPATVLHDRLLNWTRTSEIHELRRLIYTLEYPRPRVAALAPLVCEAARENDSVARGIVRSAARALVRITIVVRDRLFQNEPASVAYIGGMFLDDSIRQSFVEQLGRKRVSVHLPRRPPDEGALLEAIRCLTPAAALL